MTAERESIQRVIEGALELAGAQGHLLDSEIRTAHLPAESRRAFGNRAVVQYTFDRGVRQYHPDVEYATVGSALLTQAIQLVRERSTVLWLGHRSTMQAMTSCAGLLIRILKVSSAVQDLLPPHIYARAQAAITMTSDDRRTFLREVVVSAGEADDSDGQAVRLIDIARPVDVGLADVSVDLNALVDQLLAAAEKSIEGDVRRRQSELEERLRDALGRMGAGPALETLRRELRLRVEIDVAYLEIIRLERRRHRAVLIDRIAHTAVPMILETYRHQVPGSTSTAICSSCHSPAARVTVCTDGGGHVVCTACSLRCPGCGNRRCRQHPVTACTPQNVGRASARHASRVAPIVGNWCAHRTGEPVTSAPR